MSKKLITTLHQCVCVCREFHVVNCYINYINKKNVRSVAWARSCDIENDRLTVLNNGFLITAVLFNGMQDWTIGRSDKHLVSTHLTTGGWQQIDRRSYCRSATTGTRTEGRNGDEEEEEEDEKEEEATAGTSSSFHFVPLMDANNFTGVLI